jgi:hypothetical protein
VQPVVWTNAGNKSEDSLFFVEKAEGPISHNNRDICRCKETRADYLVWIKVEAIIGPKNARLPVWHGSLSDYRCATA